MDLLKPSHARSAIFFDRDGVLNADLGYIYKIEDFSWIDGAIEAIALCKKLNYYVFVVTNQSGVARGYYSELDIHKLHQYMQTCLHKYGAYIDAFAYCPHHEQGIVEKYAKACQCRKPQAFMITNLMQLWSIDANSSLLIGDKERDILAAKAAGIRGELFTGGNLKLFVENLQDNSFVSV